MTDDALAWAARVTGRPVTGSTRLEGGMTSTMLRLAHATGGDTVLRLMTEHPWVRHGAELTTREAETQAALADTPVPAPRSLALDAAGAHTGVAGHLMTLLPGVLDQERTDDGSLATIARTLAAIHEVRPATWPRDFQTWAWEAKWVVPAWATRPDAWARAFEVLAAGDPAYAPCFLHRDFSPRNLLWTGDEITGVVDWVETSTGPAWLDVAHGASNLALRHGPDRAARFAAAYAGETGRVREPWWEVLDVVGFLPPPGGAFWNLGDDGWRALEDLLADALDHLS